MNASKVAMLLSVSVSILMGVAAPPAQAEKSASPRLIAAKGPAKGGAKGGASGLPLWSRNIKVPHRAWLPEDKPREVLLCVHGLGFSSASFAEFGRQMAGHGMAVYAVDVRGFGQWVRRKGQDKVDFEACLADLEGALRTLRKNYPGTPIFVVGESMGGAIALNCASRYPDLVDGLISSVPSSDRYSKLSSEIMVGAHFISDGDKPIDVSQEVVNRATQSSALRKQWKAEPLNRMKLSAKELKQFEDFMKGNNDAVALIQNCPVLMLAGFKDKLVKPEGTIELFNNITSQDKLLMVVGDGEHLLLEENQLTEQLEDLLNVWIKNQSTSKRPGVTGHP